MKYLTRRSAVAGLAGLVVLIVVACGGGGTVAGIDRLGVTNGTITGFGSIFVNGIEYQTGNGTTFLVDDVPAAETDLHVGQVITIHWVSNDNGMTFRAEDVTYSASVRGAIEAGSINTIANSFVVLGQTVLVDAGTTFDSGIIPQDLSGLVDGDNVEVSGFIDAAGDIHATSVERKVAGGKLEVRGIVSALTATTFNINEQVVNYAALIPLGFSIANDDFVEVKGDTVNGSGELVATEVNLEDEGLPLGGDGDEGELEGFVTAFTSPDSFSVNGIPIVTQVGTVVTGGAVAPNVKVEVKGVFNASGVLVADSIEVKPG